MDKKAKNLNNQLYNLLLAKRSFLTATELISFLIDKAVATGKDYITTDSLFDAIFESFVITYARPFTASVPHGKLPQRIENKFNDQRKACHEELMDRRNKYHAHSDASENPVVVVPPGVQINKDIEPSKITSYLFPRQVWGIRRYRFIYNHVRELTIDIFDEIETLEKQVFPNGMPNEQFELKAL